MNNKNILVTRSSMPGFEEYCEEIKPLWESAWLTNMGEKHQELENSLKRRLDVGGVSLVSNGHMALELTLQAMNLTGEVITTPYTFASTTHAIHRNNLTPVFCDISEDDYTIDADKIERLISSRTSAIVPVHVYGNICNDEKIMEVANKYHLKVIYDAAHAFGEELKGVNIANLGDASTFSFHATKVFNTIEGGAVASNDKDIHKKIYKLKNFGIENEEIVDEIGANAKMNEFQAAMGICNLRHLDTEIQKRKLRIEKYREKLDGIPGIKLCKVQENIKSNYAYFPVVFEQEVLKFNRNQVQEQLRLNRIFARKYFYPITNDFDCYNKVYNSLSTPVAKKVSESVLCLPMYADLSINDVEEICNIILRMIKK